MHLLKDQVGVPSSVPVLDLVKLMLVNICAVVVRSIDLKGLTRLAVPNLFIDRPKFLNKKALRAK